MIIRYEPKMLNKNDKPLSVVELFGFFNWLELKGVYMNQQYTNELTPEIKAQQAKSPFSAEEIVAMDDGARAIIAEGKELERKHPVKANGDEIITPPQGHTYLATREEIASGADFLTVTGV
ncbi:hypothetical protein [Enterobacter cloacae complex sp. CARB60]|uniref:hypothetical protein n=1 Tax=Enterobacter cloacae complex sp. CARB60 TaxID=3119569 RepID=UPI002F40790F